MVLDLCCGSGDLAMSVIQTLPSPARCIGIDLATGMVECARAKAALRPTQERLAFLSGDVESMPFPDHYFDVAMVGFGIRNVESIPKAVAEVIRVLKPGGTFFSLEFSKPTRFPLTIAYPFYLHRILPRVGGWISGEPGAYRYLAESIKAFPDQPSLAEALREGGLENVRWTNLTGGIVAVHQGTAPLSQ
jgi:demethylmenaquinone methyltransferase/2-methoxy-6-polyprenyl-1,4-benzoquinol methylase